MPVSVHLCYAIIIVNYAISKGADNVLNLFYTVSNFFQTHINKKARSICRRQIKHYYFKKTNSFAADNSPEKL